ncbi:TonB family protein [Phenylobacterium sp.]|jgi:TonB family protein|uniref:TonB family protein n=1 Tax=Phenylobacterium sp. TaxID=1871053 RepID=UPI002E32FCF0|nr:TonB family protein [Phenylobacterium sp.]HEX2560545.1 TonB family protein [Phenylobacterium sp.]
MIISLVSAAALAAGYVDPAQVVWARPEKIVRRVLQYYPRDAQRRGVTGSATIDCRIAEGGVLEDCRAVSETPAGEGFGDAAVRMRELFNARPVLKNGDPLPVGARLVFTIRFVLPGRAAP